MSQIIKLEGRNTIHDVLAGGKAVRRIWLSNQAEKGEKLDEIISMAGKAGVQIEYLSSKKLHKMTDSYNAQNIVAELVIETPRLDEILEGKDEPLLLAINRLDYEQNLGAILRVAWGAGVDAVLVANRGVHEITPVVAKVSMGGAAFVPVISGSLFPLLKQIRKAGLPIVGVENGLGKDYTKVELRGPRVIVMGGEDSGLSEPLQKYCDMLVQIPMYSGLSSLNVGVATALVLWEKRRQDGNSEIRRQK